MNNTLTILFRFVVLDKLYCNLYVTCTFRESSTSKTRSLVFTGPLIFSKLPLQLVYTKQDVFVIAVSKEPYVNFSTYKN